MWQHQHAVAGVGTAPWIWSCLTSRGSSWSIGGLPRELTADLSRHIIQTVGQQSPSFQALQGVQVRRLPGSRRNRAVFLAHPAFAQAGPVQNVWRELTQRLQHTENQCTLPTPSGPVRLEVARRSTPSPRQSEASRLEIGISVMLLRRLPQWRGRSLCAWMAPTLLL